MDGPGRLDTEELGADDPADGMDRGAVAVDQHGEVARGDRGGGDDGRRAAPPGIEVRGISEEHGPLRPLERGVGGVVGHQDEVAPRPRLLAGSGGPAERVGRFTEHGKDLARLERDEPGPVVVGADGDRHGHRRIEGLDRAEPAVGDDPSAPVGRWVEALRCVVVGRSQEEGDALGTHTHGPELLRCGVEVVDRSTEHAVRRLEGLERRHVLEAPQQRGGVRRIV